MRGQIFDIAHPKLNLQLISSNLDLNAVQAAINVLPRNPQIRWSAPASVTASITGRGSSPVVTVSARVQHAKVYGTSFSNITTNGFYQSKTIHVTNLTGNTAKGSVSMQGNIALVPLHLVASGKLNALELAEVPSIRIAHPRGTTTGTFKLEYSQHVQTTRLDVNVTNGALSDLAFERGHILASVSGPGNGEFIINTTNGSARGITYEQGSADMSLNRRRVVVRQASIKTLDGGIFHASGTALIGGAVNIDVTGHGVNVQRILVPLGYKQFTGMADFHGSVTGDFADPHLAITLTSRNGRIRQSPYDVLSANIYLDKNAILIDNAKLKRAETQVTTIGRITITKHHPPTFNIRLVAEQLQLARLLTTFSINQHDTGLVNADLSIKGSLPNIAATGRIDLTDANIGGERIDSARLGLHYLRNRIVITQLFATRDDMKVIGDGFIENADKIEINLTGQNLNMSLFNDIIKPYVVTEGAFNFVGQIKGTIDHPVISGNMDGSSVLINSQQFDRINAVMAWDTSRLRFTDAFLTRQGANYQIHSLVYTPSSRDIAMQGEVKLGRLEQMIALFQNSPAFNKPEGAKIRRMINTIPKPFSGSMKALFNLSGRTGDLIGDASLELQDIQMGTQRLNSVDIGVAVQRSSFVLNRLAITSHDLNIAAQAQFLNTQPTNISATIKHTNAGSLGDLVKDLPFLAAYDIGETLTSLVAKIPQPVAGTIDAVVEISNPMTNPTGTFSAEIANLSVKSTPIGTIKSNVRLDNGSVFIDRLLVLQPSGQATVQGTMNTNGVISLTGTGSNLDLGMMLPWLHLTSLSGGMDFRFDAQGPFDNPLVTASVGVHNITVNGLSFESISTDHITIGAGRISTSGLTIANQGARINAFGSLPFVFQKPFIPTDQPVHLSITASDPSLNLANSFSPYVTRSQGNLSADIITTGTIDHPTLDGSVTLTNGIVDLRGFKNSFTGITIAAKFTGNTIQIENVSGVSSLGGKFSATGSITVNDLRSIAQSPITAFASTQSLRISVDNVTNSLHEAAVFTTTGQIITTQTLGNPLVQGQLVVTDARIQLPSNLVSTSVQLPNLPINPQFAITVDLTRNVVIQRGILRAEIQGPVTFAGVFPRPTVSGTVQITDGKIRYAGRTLELLNGGTSSFILQPLQPAIISVNVSARTRFSALSQISNRITRYTVTMDISGYIGHLDITTRSSPPGLTDVQALGNMFGGTAFQALAQGVPFPQLFQQQLGQILMGVAVPALFQPVSLGPVTLSLEPGFNIPLQITASTAITDKIGLSYSRSVMGNLPIDTIGLDYTISRHFALSLQLEGQNNAPRQTYLFVEYFTVFK